jgi:hypothetical protein
MQGLSEAGWCGDERIVRFAYAASAGLRFGLLAGLLLRQVHTPQRYPAIEQRYQRSIDDIFTQRAAVIRHALALADEARALLPVVG